MGTDFDWRFLLPLAMFSYRLWEDIESRAYDRPLDPVANWLIRPWTIGSDSARLPNRAVGSLRLAFWCMCIAGALAAVIHPGFSVPTPGWLPYAMLAVLVGWFAGLSTVRVRDFYRSRLHVRMTQAGDTSNEQAGRNRAGFRAIANITIVLAMLWAGFAAATAWAFAYGHWQA